MGFWLIPQSAQTSSAEAPDDKFENLRMAFSLMQKIGHSMEAV